nr:hypothetical protein BaRGS_023182 [Batillaria attramentaria]
MAGKLCGNFKRRRQQPYNPILENVDSDSDSDFYYFYPHKVRDRTVETLSEDEEDDIIATGTGEGVSISAMPSMNSSTNFTPTPGGPFSALTPSMWPQDIISRINHPPEDPNGQLDYRYDEFGFKVEEEDGPEENSSKLLSTPFVEDPQHRLKWTAYLEFTHNNEVGDLTWDKVEPRLPRSEKLRNMAREGIPHSLRPNIWMRISGAYEKKLKSDLSYKDVVKASSNDHLMTSKQIEKIAASLLLFMEEEDTFWMMCAIIEDLLPASYYSSTLIGIQADQRVLRQLLISYLPDIDLVLKEHDIELSLISLHWFLTLFASVVHMKEGELKSLDNSAQIFNSLSDVPGDVQDVDELIDQLNKRHLRRSRSLVSMLLWGNGQEDEDGGKAKNIRQTELLVDLREAILQIARHFQSLDPKNNKVILQPDYSMDSHALDLENYVNVARNRRRRAKALLDFERHDDDELGFRKNDIITAATREVEKDFQSVYSRLVLCKTYRLDEDGKVLTPEEVMYRAVQAVNVSHDACHAQMDVKFRSLICCGLNEQVLHLWLETLCSCVEVVEKWYHPWSFLRSPGWVQIKCELRLLAAFAFNLSLTWELPQKKVLRSEKLRQGVRDMLITHHLFSWDL